jgi:hypothetical protein
MGDLSAMSDAEQEAAIASGDRDWDFLSLIREHLAEAGIYLVPLNTLFEMHDVLVKIKAFRNTRRGDYDAMRLGRVKTDPELKTWLDHFERLLCGLPGATSFLARTTNGLTVEAQGSAS